MKKISKTRTRKSRTASKPKAVPVGVPTIGQRLQMTRRAITMIAAGLGVDCDELHRIKPEVEAVSLTRGDVTMLVGLLSVSDDHAYWLSRLPADVLAALAPDHDQRESFTALELAVSGGGR